MSYVNQYICINCMMDYGRALNPDYTPVYTTQEVIDLSLFDNVLDKDTHLEANPGHVVSKVPQE